MLARADWERAINAAGFPVTVDHYFDVDTFTGFLPCTYAGSPSGFEYFPSVVTVAEASAAGAPLGTDFLVTFVTHSDLREFAASVSAASALCQASGSLLVDPQSGEVYAGSEAIAWATVQLKEVQSHLG